MDKEKVIEIITNYLDIPPSELTPDKTLKSLGVDSLDFVEIFYELEEEFDIDIPQEMGELREEVVCVSDVFRLLEKYSNQ